MLIFNFWRKFKIPYRVYNTTKSCEKSEILFLLPAVFLTTKLRKTFPTCFIDNINSNQYSSSFIFAQMKVWKVVYSMQFKMILTFIFFVNFWSDFLRIYSLNGTVSVIAKKAISDSLRYELCLIKYELDSHEYNFRKILFLIVSSLQKELMHFYCRRT